MEMAVSMTDMVKRIKAGELPATRHLESPVLVEIANLLFTQSKVKGVVVVLNKIEDDETESYMITKLAEQGIKPIGTIHRDPSIAVSWLKGTSLDAVKTRKDTEKIIEGLEITENMYPV